MVMKINSHLFLTVQSYCVAVTVDNQNTTHCLFGTVRSHDVHVYIQTCANVVLFQICDTDVQFDDQ